MVWKRSASRSLTQRPVRSGARPPSACLPWQDEQWRRKVAMPASAAFLSPANGLAVGVVWAKAGRVRYRKTQIREIDISGDYCNDNAATCGDRRLTARRRLVGGSSPAGSSA